MGRPRLYNTPEEKAVANRAKSHRNYEKSKNAINKKRRREYRKAHPISEAHIEPVTLKTDMAQSATAKAISIWLQSAARIERRLQKIVGNSPTEYLDSLCQKYLVEKDKDAIHEQTIILGKLQKSIYKYQNEVYAIVGVGVEYQTIDVVVKSVCMVISWVEELLCWAMVDPEEVERLYNGHKFMYQTL